MENKKHNQLNTSAAIIISSIIIGVSIVIGMSRIGTNNMSIDPEKIFQGRSFAKNEMLMGSTNNDVIFLTYTDTECPFCKMFETGTVSKIRDNYKGKIGFATRKYPLPMHPQATIESLASLCAREQGGAEIYDKYNQEIFNKTKSNNGFEPNQIAMVMTQIATGLKLDISKFNTCQNASSTKALLQADIADGAAAGVEGTPYSLVLVRRGSDYQIMSRINGARDYDYVATLDLTALNVEAFAFAGLPGR